VVRRRSAVPRRVGAVHHARPLRLPHAVQPRHPARGSGHPAARWRPVEKDARKIWRTFAANYHLFRGTPTRIWLDHAFSTVFGIAERLSAETADRAFDSINECLARPEFRPRALFERFNIEVIATTESPLDTLPHHKKLKTSGWKGRVVTAYRPDPVVDPEFEGFRENVRRFGELAREDTASWKGYLAAHRERRAYFKTMGATSTDHGHPTARTCDLSARGLPTPSRPRTRGHGDA
jgi:glucuronate isomerase